LSLASIASAGLVQADGWQCWFKTVQQRLMAVMTSLTLAKPPPRRSAWLSMIETNTSTRFSHDADIGV
jgi:hypothetical protein